MKLVFGSPSGSRSIVTFEEIGAAVGVQIGSINQILTDLATAQQDIIDTAAALAVTVADLDAVVDVLSGVKVSTLANPGSTASLTFVDLGGPEVTVTVSASGKVLVTLGSYIGNSCSAADIIGGSIGYSLDGAAAVEVVLIDMGSNSGNESIQGSQGTSLVLTGLSAGTHTIRLKYKAIDTAGGGNSADFALAFIIAQPLVG